MGETTALRPEQHRGFVLCVNDRIAGRFTTRNATETEEERVCRLALKDGHAVTTRIFWDPPMPETEQELRDFQIDARLY